MKLIQIYEEFLKLQKWKLRKLTTEFLTLRPPPTLYTPEQNLSLQEKSIIYYSSHMELLQSREVKLLSLLDCQAKVPSSEDEPSTLVSD